MKRNTTALLLVSASLSVAFTGDALITMGNHVIGQTMLAEAFCYAVIAFIIAKESKTVAVAFSFAMFPFVYYVESWAHAGQFMALDTMFANLVMMLCLSGVYLASVHDFFKSWRAF